MANQVQIMAGFVPNPIYTISLKRYAFPGNRLSSHMITRYIAIPYFTVDDDDTTVTRGIVLNMYARGRCILEKWPPSTSQRAVAALEAIAPNLPDSCFATRNDSRKYFALSTMHYINKNGSTSNYHRRENWPAVTVPAGRDGAVVINQILGRFTTANIDSLNDNFIRGVRVILGLPDGADVIPAEGITNHMAEACAIFLESLALEPTAPALALSTEIYCLAYISIAKQGNITDTKLTSICNAMADETGRAMSITVEEVRSFSTSFKPFINSENAEAICVGLRQGMENFSLRLCITMQQATRSGMTAYWIIWEALTLCADFNWTAIAEILPHEFRRYSDAVHLVGNNQYFGFNTDLGIAKHTNYMSLSWVASRVLMKSDPPTYSALARYRGLPTQPKRSDDINAILDQYQPGVPDGDRQIGTNALAMVRANIEQALRQQQAKV